MAQAWLQPPDGKPYEGPQARGFLFLIAIGVAAVMDTLDGTIGPAWLSWTGLVVADLLYAAAILQAFAGHRSRSTWLLGALVTVVTAMAFILGGGWFYLFPLAGVACGVVLYGRAVRVGLFALTGLTALVLWQAGRSFEAISAFSWTTFSVGVVVAIILHLNALILELGQTRQKLAEAAVAQERLRFSRDLHDLLGHTLSVIVVKAEAVRRLARRDPEQAERQAADIEAVGRQALTEIREAVTGYREGSLATELDRARDALKAAGVQVVVRRSGQALPAESEALLGWVVREGATNIIRHSGATRAEFDLTGHVLTIHDNGTAQPAPSGGSGLRGLAERLAQAGGTLESGPHPDGGFSIVANLEGATGVRQM